MLMDIQDWDYLISMAATVAFAVTAVLAVTDNDIDLFGAVVLGIITSVGGGTFQVPLLWGHTPWHLRLLNIGKTKKLNNEKQINKESVAAVPKEVEGLEAKLIEMADKVRTLAELSLHEESSALSISESLTTSEKEILDL